jgi:formate hydrogenlyase subunit 6/NADH:ubiquinone oxidoreductase subunit I
MWIVKKSDKDIFLKRLKDEYGFFNAADVELPPKQYFFPPVETTFNVRLRDNLLSVPRVSEKFVLYGLSLADLEAITCLDLIMSTPEKDYYYFRRKERALLIGVTDEPFDLSAPPGGDIIFSSSSKDSHLAIAVTKKGKEALKKYLPKSKAIPKGSSFHRPTKKNQIMPELKKLFMDTELLKDAVEWSWSSYPRLWKGLKEECLGCGICTYVCPICHCFSTEDAIELSGKCASRCRKWDACTLPGFAKISGGHDFHPTIKERYYNWYYHKFVRAYLEFGRAQCVGCGRCQTSCPARIDIEEVLVDIVKKFKKTRHK